MKRHGGSLGWFEDESKPTVSVQLFVDYAQKERAFDLVPGREATRAIVGAFFDGATFYRTTGIWKRKESGGLSITLYFVPQETNVDKARKRFIERARTCAKYLQETFFQEAVGMLTLKDGGTHRVEFIGDWSKTQDITELVPRLSAAQVRKLETARAAAQGRRLTGPSVWGD